MVVIGGGLLGLITAFYLRKFAPERSVLLVEQGGIPSEEGETHYSPAIHHRFYRDEEQRRRARWWSGVLAQPEIESGVTIALKNSFAPVSYLSSDPAAIKLATIGLDGLQPVRAGDYRGTMVERFFAFAPDARLALDPAGGCGNAEALALHFGYGAVALGADLCLNARASFDREGHVRLDRLTINNRMEIEIARRSGVRGGTLIVAAGAATGPLIEHQLGELTPFRRYFAQFPRIDFEPPFPLRADGTLDCPVVSCGDITIRPHLDGAIVVPAPLPPDPDGYTPHGGRLMGVNVGLRKELITQFVGRMEAIPGARAAVLQFGQGPAQSPRGVGSPHAGRRAGISAGRRSRCLCAGRRTAGFLPGPRRRARARRAPDRVAPAVAVSPRVPLGICLRCGLADGVMAATAPRPC